MKPKLRRAPWVVAAVFVLTACRQPRPAGVAGAPNAPPAPGGEAGALCLAEATGTPVVDRALREAQRGARALPQSTDGWVGAGRQWVRKARLASDPGFYVHVAACADAALTVESGFRPALELRGLALMNDHRFAEARDVSRAILEGEPSDAIALGTLSDASLELGDFDAAAGAAQQLLNTRPGMAAYSRASYLRWLQGDVRGAKTLVLQALRSGRDARDPEPAAWTFVQAGQIFWHEGDYE